VAMFATMLRRDRERNGLRIDHSGTALS